MLVNPRAPKVSHWIRSGVLLALSTSPTPGEAAETIQLKFDWGPELLAFIESSKSTPQSGRSGTAAAPSGGSAAPSSSGPTASGQPGGKWRVRATRAPDGSYEVRTVDYALVTQAGDVVIPAGSNANPTRLLLAPDVRLGPGGSFIDLLDRTAIEEFFRRTYLREGERSAVASPEAPSRRPESADRAQLDGFIENIARRPWDEAVGHWAGRRLDLGQVYTSSEIRDGAVFSTKPTKYRVDKTWSASGRESCNSGETAPASVGDAAPLCVRLKLKTVYTQIADVTGTGETAASRPPPRLESEAETLTEPATLRPHTVTRLAKLVIEVPGQSADVRVIESVNTRWRYGPAAAEPVQSSFDMSQAPIRPPRTQPDNGPPLPPAKVWPSRTPERMVADFYAAGARPDWAAVASLLHPDLLRRAGERFRSTAGSRGSEANRKALVGDGVTAEQVDAMGDEDLYVLVASRTSLRGRIAGAMLMMSGGEPEILGHATDSAGRAHVVVHARTRQLPDEIRYQSFTVVAWRRAATAASSAGAAARPAQGCDRKTDQHDCWRIWVYSDAEFGPMFQLQMSSPPVRLSPPDTRTAPAPPEGRAPSPPPAVPAQ